MKLLPYIKYFINKDKGILKMSILQSDLEIFDNLMDSVNKNIARDPSKLVMESISIKNSKNILNEAQTKRRKDFQKKKTDLIGKKKIILDSKKMLKELHEAMLRDSGYVSDDVTKSMFFEACSAMNKSLTEMDNTVKAELDTLADLTKKYDEAKLTPEEENYIKNTDPSLELASTVGIDEKKKSMKPTVPATM